MCCNSNFTRRKRLFYLLLSITSSPVKRFRNNRRKQVIDLMKLREMNFWTSSIEIFVMLIKMRFIREFYFYQLMTMFWVFSFFFPFIIYTFLALYLRVLKVYFMRLKLCPNFFIIIFVVVCDVFRREIITRGANYWGIVIMIVTCCQITGYNVTFRFSTRQSSVNDLNIWHRKDNFAYSFRVLFHFLPHLAKITSREESIFIALS